MNAALQTLSAALARFWGEPRQALGLTLQDDAAAARRAWLLRVGWRRHGAIGVHDVPGDATVRSSPPRRPSRAGGAA